MELARSSARVVATLATLASLATLGAVGLAAPATAAPDGADERASCVGQVFAPQAYGSPRAIAERIAEIKSFVPVSFGAVIGDFARWDDCAG